LPLKERKSHYLHLFFLHGFASADVFYDLASFFFYYL
jgi:hypothetical protein